jgi:hypothetical protein
MATGLSSAAATALLASLIGTYKYVQLHDGDPGSAGTANVADETTRLEASWDTPAAGSVATDTDLEWTDVTVSSGTQDYTHFTVWDAATSGNFGFSGTVTANPVSDSDNFTIPAGDLTASLPTAS